MIIKLNVDGIVKKPPDKGYRSIYEFSIFFFYFFFAMIASTPYIQYIIIPRKERVLIFTHPFYPSVCFEDKRDSTPFLQQARNLLHSKLTLGGDVDN